MDVCLYVCLGGVGVCVWCGCLWVLLGGMCMCGELGIGGDMGVSEFFKCLYCVLMDGGGEAPREKGEGLLLVG